MRHQNQIKGGEITNGFEEIKHNCDALYFIPTIRAWLNAFSHGGWDHVLLNMLCFLVAGLYLERRTGTFGLLIFVAVGAYFSGISITANDLSVAYHGFSGVNFLTYACILVDYLFGFEKDRRNKTNIILGGIVLGILYIAMCYNDSAAFPFSPYPHDLIYNMAHYSSFLFGLIASTIVNLIILRVKHKENNKQSD